MTARDSQRKRLYNSERALDGVARGRHLEAVGDLQAYVDALLASRWFKARWGAWGTIQVKPGGGRRSACAEGRYVIKMPRWSRCELVTLHEVAHCLTPGRYADHGPEFAGVFLSLVRQSMGQHAAASLRASFREHRVRYTMAAMPQPLYRVGLPRRPRRNAA